MIPEKLGRYEVQGVLGEGSMGRVFRAFDPLGRREVAIKTLKPEYHSADTAEEYLKRFRREAQAAGALSHPAIITVFDVGEDYFVMEILPGTTLQQILRERGKLDLGEALRLLGPVAEALDYAHTKGVIHRDIKPGNIIVLPDGRPKLMDFGVAHITSTVMTASGQFLGSPSYMAPEQITRSEASPQTDLFSLGVVAYEALTGKKPFQGDTITTIVYRVVNEDPPPPRSWNVDLPPQYDDIFRRALSKDPAGRYSTASDFIAALSLRETDAALSSLPPAPPVTPAPPAASVETQHLKKPGAASEGRHVPKALGSPTRWAGLTITAATVALLAALAIAAFRKPTAGPAAASTPAATLAALEVRTQPDGARVLLDGRPAGVSPLSLDRLRPGPHTVRVIRDGYAPAEVSLELAAGTAPIPLRFNLQPLVASAGAPPSPGFPSPGGLKGKGRSRPREGDLVELGPGVTPPQRISGDPAPYPEAARKLRMQGVVTIEMVVSETGEPTEMSVVESAGEVLDQAVLDAVRSWRYEPAMKDGVKVRMRQQYRQSFTITG